MQLALLLARKYPITSKVLGTGQEDVGVGEGGVVGLGWGCGVGQGTKTKVNVCCNIVSLLKIMLVGYKPWR